jgi:hypothetical protein
LCRICSRANLDSQLETLAASNAAAAASIPTSNANVIAYDATAANDAAADDAAANDVAANDAAAYDAAANDDVTGSPSDVGICSPNWLCYASAAMHPS